MLGFTDFINSNIGEGWAKPNKFPPLDEIIDKMDKENPKRILTVGKFWKKNVTKLSNDEDSLRCALCAIYCLGYTGKPLPPNLSSGYGMPEQGYKFKARKDRYHTHLTRKSKFTLCWQYGSGHGDIMFDLVSHKEYNKYLESEHKGEHFIVPNI